MLPDTQAAIFLLRLSFGIVRATHFTRTTPITLWTKQAEQFDAKVRDTVFQILGLQQTPEAYDQISVSTTIGGLGIRRVLDHAKGAFTASWHEGYHQRILDNTLFPRLLGRLPNSAQSIREC